MLFLYFTFRTYYNNDQRTLLIIWNVTLNFRWIVTVEVVHLDYFILQLFTWMKVNIFTSTRFHHSILKSNVYMLLNKFHMKVRIVIICYISYSCLEKKKRTYFHERKYNNNLSLVVITCSSLLFTSAFRYLSIKH